ncbi:MAG: hypothetical protein NWE93_07205 [Candidatus Bathyarchaeota archaeon]|nr:hypothetical protein [Candidatus Bathyarchaeota archaeon]
MGRTRKASTFAFLLVLLAASLFPAAFAQSIPKPKVPEFTVAYVDLSYDVPATTSIDQYSGKTVTTPGYHVMNRTLQLAIKNQPFTSTLLDGQNVSFYYNVKVKGQYTSDWITVYNPDLYYPTQSASDTTVLYYLIDRNEYPFWDHLVDGGTVDFQVQALIGAVHRISNITGGNQDPLDMFPWVFEGETSSWSSTQTISIPEDSVFASSQPGQTSSQTPDTNAPTSSAIEYTQSDAEFNWLAVAASVIVGIVVTLLVVFLVLMHRKIRVLEAKQSGAE